LRGECIAFGRSSKIQQVPPKNGMGYAVQVHVRAGRIYPNAHYRGVGARSFQLEGDAMEIVRESRAIEMLLDPHNPNGSCLIQGAPLLWVWKWDNPARRFVVFRSVAIGSTSGRELKHRAHRERFIDALSRRLKGNLQSRRRKSPVRLPCGLCD